MGIHKQLVKLLGEGPFESTARRAYGAYRDHLPGRLVSREELKSRHYDQLTAQIAKMSVSDGDNCVDIGAHAGAILRTLVKLSPSGQHWAFEPIPNLAEQLQRRFPKVHVMQAALSDRSGRAEFRYLPESAGYSSLLPRPGVEAGKKVRILDVTVRRLDDCLDPEIPISLIKIDVEGAEASVLKGAAVTLQRHRPVVVFECAPTRLTDCVPALTQARLHISFLSDYVSGRRKKLDEVIKIGLRQHEYYYVAARE